MKTSFFRADGHAFLILKYGLFIIISMFAFTFLHCQILLERENFDTAAYIFYILPLARAMVEHTMSALVLVFGFALLTVIAEMSQNSD